MPDYDHANLHAMRRGDHAAAARLWADHAPRLLGLARLILPASDRHLAPDAVQNAFLRVLNLSARDAAAIGSVPAYLVAAVRACTLNIARGEQRHTRRLTFIPPTPAGADRPDPDPELLSALHALAPESRHLLALKHVAGLTFEQMAEVLSENRNTVAGRYRAALAELRAHLQSKDPRKEAAHA